MASSHILRGKVQGVKDLKGQARLKYTPGPEGDDSPQLPSPSDPQTQEWGTSGSVHTALFLWRA